METDICESSHCKSHEHVEKTMERLQVISDRLSTGQAEIIAVVRDVSRLGERIEKLESKQDEIRTYMWKIMGVVGAAAFIIPLAVTLIVTQM